MMIASSYRVQVTSESSAFMITKYYLKVNRPDFPLNWQSTEHMPKIAWKTGTSYGRRDGWSIGYNKRFTVGVWTGNFSEKERPELSGADIATPLLFRIFNAIDYDSDEEWFDTAGGLRHADRLRETGMPPADFCKDRVTDFFIPLVSPVAVCNNYNEEIISADGRMSYCRVCCPQTVTGKN